jgi:mRNA interferase HigB
MHILSKRTLRLFWELHHDAEKQLLGWFKEMEKGEFKSTNEIIQVFSNCRSIGLNRYVFNIKGNKYRLVVKINFDLKTAWIRFVGTHAEYDKIDSMSI